MSTKFPQSPRDRYLSDPAYKALVDTLEHMIHSAQFTPSELREAAILASINYDSIQVRRNFIPMTEELHQRLNEFHKIVTKISYDH